VPTEILLIRHGQTESNRTGYYMGWSAEDLNAAGLEQVQRLSSRLARLSIVAIYSSPLQRAFHTADIIAAHHNIKVTSLQDFIEINQGKLEGVHRSETERRYPELWKHLRTDPFQAIFPGGESFSQVAERTVRSFESVVAENLNKQILIVSHEINIKMIVIHALRAPYNIYRLFEISNASLSKVRTSQGSLRVITLNDKSHLEGMG
jgi:broad specificity phosphatase PhoE